MRNQIRLLSTDFDGTIVSHASNPGFDARCLDLFREVQASGGIWAINTGRSVSLVEEGLADFDFPIRPDFIVTSERDLFRPGARGEPWEPFGDWNSRCAQAHAELWATSAEILARVIAFIDRMTHAKIIYEFGEPAGIIARDEAEMDRITAFIDSARADQPQFHYQRNMIYLRFSHVDYHKGAALAELSRLTGIPRSQTFAAGDNHNDLSMLDGRYAQFPACPANAIPEVKQTVRNAGGYVAESECGAGVREALLYFTSQ